jgi:hypothetical protein
LHERQCVAVRIIKECHAKIVIIHLGDEMRLDSERDAPLLQFGDSKLKISAPEVDAADWSE